MFIRQTVEFLPGFYLLVVVGGLTLVFIPITFAHRLIFFVFVHVIVHDIAGANIFVIIVVFTVGVVVVISIDVLVAGITPIIIACILFLSLFLLL